jgi:hypothetical protein
MRLKSGLTIFLFHPKTYSVDENDTQAPWRILLALNLPRFFNPKEK